MTAPDATSMTLVTRTDAPLAPLEASALVRPVTKVATPAGVDAQPAGPPVTTTEKGTEEAPVVGVVLPVGEAVFVDVDDADDVDVPVRVAVDELDEVPVPSVGGWERGTA